MSSYELRIPKGSGDVVLLGYVSTAMARAAATADGHLPVHLPSYEVACQEFSSMLLVEARSGRLPVCNQYGAPGTVDDVLDKADASGTMCKVLSDLDEPNWTLTHINSIFAKLHHLNEWGKTRGDSFSISDEWVEWIDERGVLTNPIAVEVNKSTISPEEVASTNEKTTETQALGEPEVPDKNFWIDRTTVISRFVVYQNPDKNAAFWKERIGRPPKWLKDARMFSGRPGTSSLWHPITLAHCLLGRKILNLKQLDFVMHKHFPELKERWRLETEDMRASP